MGLLKALFKRKAEKLPPQSVNQPEGEVKDLEAGLETLHLQDTPGQNPGGLLPNSSTGTQQPWDLHGGPLPGLLGENPLDAIVDIEATSLEAVDYTHEEEAPPIINIIPNDQHQRRDNDNDNDEQASSASGATEQSLPSNGVEEGVQVDSEKDLATLQEDTVSDFEPEPEEQHQENFENTPGDVAAGDSPSPPPPVVGDLSMLSLAPLQSVLYLTEDGENMADTISVVSGGYGPTSSTNCAGGGVDGGGVQGERGTAELAEEINELGRALETLEAEIPGSPLSGAAGGVGGGGGSLLSAGGDSSIAAAGNTTIAQPSSPGGSMSTTSVSVADGARFSSSMVKLYNDLALRLMDAKEYDQALQMLSKAETILDNDAAWAPPSGFSASGSGSLDTSSTGNNNYSGGGVPGLSSHSFDRNISGSFNLGSAQESSLDEAAFTAAAAATLAGMNGLQVILEKIAVKRNRLRAITYNNIGCLYKRLSLPERALPYLQNALSLEEAAGDVHDCASTHLNLCASYSALTRFREALAHAERAIILLQRQLWGPTAGSFQDGMTYLGRVLAALAATVAAGPGGSGANGATNGSGDPSSNSTAAAATAVAATYEEAHKRQRKLLANANILAMAYHNAAVEHERLKSLREAQVSYSRACSIGTKFLGPKSSTTVALLHAQKGFVARQQREAGAMATHHSSGGGGGGGGSGAKGHVMTSRSSTNLASKARQGSSTTKRTPLGGASSSSRMGKSSSSSIASKLARR